MAATVAGGGIRGHTGGSGPGLLKLPHRQVLQFQGAETEAPVGSSCGIPRTGGPSRLGVQVERLLAVPP